MTVSRSQAGQGRTLTSQPDPQNPGQYTGNWAHNNQQDLNEAHIPMDNSPY